MTMSLLFTLSFMLVAPFWGLMMLAPRWSWTQKIMQSPWVAAPAALLYAVLVLPQFMSVFPAVLMPSLDGIRTLLATEIGTTIGWVHFLAFDLFVGRWAYLDSRQRNISPLLMAPILFMVLMLGPIGFLLYMLVRQSQD